MVKILCDIPSEADEKDAGGLWDLAGELAEMAGLERGLETPVYGEEYGQEAIYNRLRELVVDREKMPIKEKEIEAMAQFIYGRRDKNGSFKTAVALVNAGYGDIKQAVKEFADYLSEYANACKSSGYDGIGAEDIQDKLKEWLKNG